MNTLKIASHTKALQHLKSKGFNGSEIVAPTCEEIEYLTKHTTVKNFPQFTVEVLMVDGEFITSEQYNDKMSRIITAEQFQQVRGQLGI